MIVGYVVLRKDESGRYHDDWDGTIHPTREPADLEAADARQQGYDCAVYTLSYETGDDLNRLRSAIAYQERPQ